MKKLIKYVISLLVVCLVAFTLYVKDYYHVDDIDAAIDNTSKVTVTQIDEGYYYDGPGSKQLCIFYPGAKVEDIAYGSLLKELASQGMDCILVHMPFNLAFFGKNKADNILKEYQYDEYYLAGHSLGGAMAASYIKDHHEKYQGLLLFAAYSIDDLSNTKLNILSIYGSHDQVLKREKVEEGRKFMPENYEEYVIEGGNHGQFGDYGHQKGDGEASIESSMQKQIIVEKVIDFCKVTHK